MGHHLNNHPFTLRDPGVTSSVVNKLLLPLAFSASMNICFHFSQVSQNGKGGVNGKCIINEGRNYTPFSLSGCSSLHSHKKRAGVPAAVYSPQSVLLRVIRAGL